MTQDGRRACWLSLIAALLLTGCQTAPKPDAARGEEVRYTFPEQAYQPGDDDADRIYRVDAAESRVRVLVYRGGTLAAAGHNHVVVPGTLRGAVRLPPDGIEGAHVDIAVPLADLEVDPAQARQAVGGSFGGEVDEEARRGTRENMLGADVLDADRYPMLGLRVRETAGELPRPVLRVQVFLHGWQRTVTVPAVVGVTGDRLRASGRFAIRQSWFGVEPFSALGGALRVQDWLVVEFDVAATRAY